MTRPRNDDYSTPFGLWVRKYGPDSVREGLSIQNLDYVVHNYKQNWMTCIEEKRFRAYPKFAQVDTHSIVDQLLQNGASTGAPVLTQRGERVHITYNGFHRLRFEHTTPDDGWMEWDGRRITREQLLHILRYGVL
jgi:hypothetical protein